MKKTLKGLLIKCLEESESPEGTDPLKYPSQILCLGESIWFTTKCEEHISKGKLQNFHKALKVSFITEYSIDDFYSTNIKIFSQNWIYTQEQLWIGPTKMKF